jgi:pilus assembly protein Flp/PilA
MSVFRKLRRNASGATSIEYGLIAALITLGLISAMTVWGESASTMYTNLDEQWDAAAGGNEEGE